MKFIAMAKLNWLKSVRKDGKMPKHDVEICFGLNSIA